MRSTTLLLSLFLAACAKSDTPSTDTLAARTARSDTTPPAAIAAPAKLTAADMQGTWNGMTMAVSSDSVLRRWTSMRVSDSTGILTSLTTKQKIPYTVKFDGDSMVATSAPYASSMKPKAPKIMFRSVGRMHDGKLQGTAANMLAAKPDSVVERTRWEATKAP